MMVCYFFHCFPFYLHLFIYIYIFDFFSLFPTAPRPSHILIHATSCVLSLSLSNKSKKHNQPNRKQKMKIKTNKQKPNKTKKYRPNQNPMAFVLCWSTTPKHKACPRVRLTEQPRDASLEKSDSHFPLSVRGPV